AQADFGAHHVDDGNALGDADDEFHAGIGGFKDGVGGAGRGDENHGGVATGLGARLGDGVEHGHLLRESFAAASGSDSRHDVGAVFHALGGVESAGFS